MKTIAAFLLSLLLVAVPVGANVPSDQEIFQQYGRDHGCLNLVVTMKQRFQPNGAFSVVEGNPPQILLQWPKEFPTTYKWVIFYHELGHCMQYEQHDEFWETADMEQDADMRGADMACVDGMDGVKNTVDYFTYLHDTLGYDGDPDHGTIEEREAAAARAPHCVNNVQKHFA